MATKLPRVWVYDFETDAICRRPEYPPRPVGVSIMKPGRKSKYYAFRHPQENNCSFEDARKAMQEMWDSGDVLLAHNHKFDLDVAVTHMGLPMLPWQRIADSMFLLFLDDPHSMKLALKPSADRLLGMAPTERDELKDWLEEHIPELQRGWSAGVDRWGKEVDKPMWGAYICRAPGNLVGRYADGDVVRAKAIFDKLYPSIIERGMGEAYDRERKLLPILLRNEQEGIRADLDGMVEAHKKYTQGIETCDEWLRKRLKAPGMNVDSDTEIADALDREGVVTEWTMTAPSKTFPNGQRSTSKKTMTIDKFSDVKVFQVLGYRNRARTCLSTFLENWIDMADRPGSQRVYTNWNQVKQIASSGDDAGAKTGRLSSNPNFQNVPKAWKGFPHPKFMRSLSELPLMRQFLLPDKGEVWLKRDYKQQEYRITAHFEGGALYNAFCENPFVDMHDLVRSLILQVTGLDIDRDDVKTLNFGMLYGMGLAILADRLGVSMDEARRTKNAWTRSLPDVKALDQTLKNIGKMGDPIMTWGGRIYLCEPPREIKGIMRSFEYRLLNYLVQGSAADCTKEAMIRYDEERENARLLLSVHDEFGASCPMGKAAEEMRIMDRCMSSVGIGVGETPEEGDPRFCVPMLSDGAIGVKDWGHLAKWDDIKGAYALKEK
jgi:DNA polymerase I-like protein with 3'-5' exonuclease and polymerase domains